MNLKRLSNLVLAEMLFAVLMVVVGCVLPLTLLNSAVLKHRDLLYALEAVAVGGLGLQLLIYVTKASRRPLKLYLAIALLATGLVLLTAV
jgi:hypothetical protein